MLNFYQPVERKKPREEGNKFKANPGQWKCPECLIMNDKKENACQACETKLSSLNGSVKRRGK